MPRLADVSATPSLWIGLRFLIAGRRGIGSLNNWISFLGLTLSIALLTLVLTIQNGLDRKIQEDILESLPHAFLSDTDADDALLARLRSDGLVESVRRHFRSQGVLSHGKQVVPINLYASDSKQSSSSSDGESGGLLIDRTVRNGLNLDVGDSVVLSLPVTAGNSVRVRNETFRIAGARDSSDWQYMGVATVRLGDIIARGLAESGELGWEVVLHDPMNAGQLRDDFPMLWTWQQEMADLLRAVLLEKAIIFVIFAMVVALAVFNLVSGQMMLVNKKRSEIAILLTMGASSAMLVRIFTTHGLTIAVLGIAAGMSLGLLLAVYASPIVDFIEGLTRQNLISTVLLHSIPYEIRATDLFAIALIAVTLCGIALVRPVRSALQLNPVEALHKVN